MTIVSPSPAATETVVAERRSSVRADLEGLRADCARDHADAVARSVDDAVDAVAMARRSALAQTLAEIDAALLRMVDGTYGVCTACHAAIPVERLKFRPHAAHCVACAEKS
jgi:RNA polymerase-binding transcription factor DksA